jgi:hypothetical protein
MADILENPVNTTTDDSKDEFAAVEELQSKPETKAEEVHLPEKFKGKSAEDIYKAYEESEKKASRLGNEIGQVRKLADDLLRESLEKKAAAQQVQKEPVQTVDFFENPQEATRIAVESNPRIQALETNAENFRRMQSQQMLVQKHPDFQSVASEDEFLKWKDASTVRQRLYDAAQNYDFNAGDELLSTYKEIKALKQSQSAAQTQAVNSTENKSREKALSSASVDTGGTSETSKKIYRSADLIRLRIRDPARYEAMSDEIYQAYSDGRVK